MAKKAVTNRVGRDTDKPWIDNYPPLKEWLAKYEARCQFQVPLGDPEQPTAYVEQYLVGGKLCIVTVWANRNGWEIYTPGDSLKVAETFADAEKRLGLAS